jgi:hypothetical protein
VRGREGRIENTGVQEFRSSGEEYGIQNTEFRSQNASRWLTLIAAYCHCHCHYPGSEPRTAKGN